MVKNVSKLVLAFIAVILISFVISIAVGLIVNSPHYYPDKWLELEKKVSVFFERITLPIKTARLARLPADETILMPVYGVRLREVRDSWHAPRPDGRLHEGQDIFALKGTPVFSGTSGYVTRISTGELGGNFVYIAGTGSRRYYYAHFDRIAEGLRVSQWVTPDTVLGFVGTSGNAEGTPPHLHFGVYALRIPIDPLPLLVNR